jgi:hypothetical protein
MTYVQGDALPATSARVDMHGSAGNPSFIVAAVRIGARLAPLLGRVEAMDWFGRKRREAERRAAQRQVEALSNALYLVTGQLGCFHALLAANSVAIAFSFSIRGVRIARARARAAFLNRGPSVSSSTQRSMRALRMRS